MKSIMITQLPLITDPVNFFDAEEILVIDVLAVDSMPNILRLKLQLKEKILSFNDHFYMPVCLKCQPQNLFLKISKGIPFEFIPGIQSWVTWDKNLNSSLEKKKIYDLSYHSKIDEIIYERGWIYNTFVFPYEAQTLRRKGLNYHLDTTGIVKAVKLL